jgi:chromosome segregation ATPase
MLLNFQLEDEMRGKDEIREQLALAERRAMVIAGELEELRTQLEAAERARKAAESELHEATDRVSELNASNNSLAASKRKLEIDIQAMQVISVFHYSFE